MSRQRAAAASWARAAALGIVAYVAIDVALVFLRPRFSVLHAAESDYGSKGRYSWLMDVNFIVRCGLSLAAARAVALVVPSTPRLRVGLALLTVWALGSGLLAFFPDDPVGTPVHATGRVHLVIAAIAFVAVALGTRVTTRALMRDAAWHASVPPLAILSWGALVPGLLLGRAHLRPHSLGGLYEKLFLAVELAWLLVVAVRIVRTHSVAPDAAFAISRT